ncbi:MAG: NGG1p interacting factor NIF3 [Oleispira sp.]|nr:NGG1p interacting factor NIF3 [Oleispira sp.]
MFKLVFYVPQNQLDVVKTAIFNAGAGKIGDYDQCCWQVLGQGQFRPLAGAHPFIGTAAEMGTAGVVEVVQEYRVEMVCSDENITTAISALKTAHPYEEPAYDVWQLADL